MQLVVKNKEQINCRRPHRQVPTVAFLVGKAAFAALTPLCQPRSQKWLTPYLAVGLRSLQNGHSVSFGNLAFIDKLFIFDKNSKFFLFHWKVSWEGSYGVQRAYCQNCCLTTRDKYFAIFAGWLAFTMYWEAATSAICHHVGCKARGGIRNSCVRL
jgi:hypothetical protein